MSTSAAPSTPGLPISVGSDDDAAVLDIDERIRRSEQRLIARDDAFRLRLATIGERLPAVARPARLLAWPGLGMAGGVVAGLIVLRRIVRRRRRQNTTCDDQQRAEAAARLAHPRAYSTDLPWMRLVAFAWPLLPGHWRAKVSPGMATAMATFGVPLFERFMAWRRAAAERRHAREVLRSPPAP